MRLRLLVAVCASLLVCGSAVAQKPNSSTDFSFTPVDQEFLAYCNQLDEQFE